MESYLRIALQTLAIQIGAANRIAWKEATLQLPFLPKGETDEATAPHFNSETKTIEWKEMVPDVDKEGHNE